MKISFFVHGRPASAGSKSAYHNKETGKTIIAPASKYTRPWMESVKWGAIEKGYNGKMLLEGPIKLRLEFNLLRPKKHFRKNGELKSNVPFYKTSKPDLTKYTRAVEDSLTGLIWKDDSQVCVQETRKIYGQPEGCLIIIEEIQE